MNLYGREYGWKFYQKPVGAKIEFLDRTYNFLRFKFLTANYDFY